MNYTPVCFSVQDLQIDDEVDVIVSEWMGYMLLYEVTAVVLSGIRGELFLEVTNYEADICGGTICGVDLIENKLVLQIPRP